MAKYGEDDAKKADYDIGQLEYKYISITDGHSPRP